MRSLLIASSSLLLVLASCGGCDAETPNGTEGEGDAGEGEGEGEEGEGEEGEGEEGEGEGEEGEGEEGEGEGDAGEGEGDAGEGEGEGDAGEGEGEGEGEGDTGSDCVTDADCSGGERCRAFRDAPPNQNNFTRQCAAAVGDEENGTQCTTSAQNQCESGMCAANINLCTGFCEDDGDCAANQQCGTSNIVVTDVNGANPRGFILPVCVARTLGQQVCDVDADCAARGQTCSEIATIGQVLTPICANPPSGDGQLGDACSGTALENATACESGFCDDATNGQCIDTCESDADCAPDLVCTGSHLGNVAGRWCAEPCVTMSDCGFDAAQANSRICKRRCDVVDATFETSCTPRVGTRDLNATLTRTATACTNNGQCSGAGANFVCSGNAQNPGVCVESSNLCKSGFSVTTGSGAAAVTYCSQPCRANDDATCGGGLHCTFVSNNTSCGGAANTDLRFCQR